MLSADNSLDKTDAIATPYPVCIINFVSFMPAPAQRFANPLPIPLPAPVTTATRPSSSISSSLTVDAPPVPPPGHRPCAAAGCRVASCGRERPERLLGKNLLIHDLPLDTGGFARRPNQQSTFDTKPTHAAGTQHGKPRQQKWCRGPVFAAEPCRYLHTRTARKIIERGVAGLY